MSNRTRRIAAPLIACALALALPPAATAEPLAFAEEDRLSSTLELADRHLDMDATARRLFEIGRERGREGLHVVTYDLDRLRRIGSAAIPGSQSADGGRLSAVDELRHRLFVVFPQPELPIAPPLSAVRDEGRAVFGVAMLDALTGDVVAARSLVLPAVARDRGAGNEVGLKAMSYFGADGEDKLYLVTEVPLGQGQFTVSTHSVSVHEIEVERLLSGAPDAVNWTMPLTACGMTVSGEGLQPSVILRRRASDTPELWVPCRAGAWLSISAQPGETPGLVRLRWEEGAAGPVGARTDFFPITGDLRSGLVAADPVAERIFLQSSGFAGEKVVWVFDARQGAWLGAVVLPLTTVTAMGIDPSFGRLYVLAATAAEGADPVLEAVITSTRARLVDQGRALEAPLTNGLDFARPVFDPERRRLFALEPGGIKIVRDRIPPPRPQLDFDPDDATIDVDEGPDTAVNFLGNAGAFGSRIRWVGGPRGVERNFNALGDLDIFLGTGSLLPAAPSPGTRDLHFARVRNATLTNDEATAHASGAERDAETDTDLGNWTAYLRRWGGPDVTEQRWPYPAVRCSDFGGADDEREGRGLGGRAACDRHGGRTFARAVAELGAGEMGLSVGESRARTVVTRDPVRGVVARATAEASAIEFGERAGIGRISAVAETWATGRPARSNGVGAGSEWRRTIEDVWVAAPDGERRVVCGSRCDAAVVADALNQALGARVRIEFPEPDAERREGSPGGYEAIVMQSLARQANDVALNEEIDIRFEVPAMVMTVFTDGRVASRVVAAFAGVTAESHYGIYRLAGDGPLSPGASAPVPHLRPVVPGVPLGPEIPPPPPSAGTDGFVRKTIDGLALVLSSPSQAARAAGVWFFLVSPLVLRLRRRGV